MAASVASSWGPGFVVGVRRPAKRAARPKAVRVAAVEVQPAPMRRRFEAPRPVAPAPVPVRSRRIERPVPGTAPARARRRVAGRSSADVLCTRAVPRKLRLTRRGRVMALVLVAIAVYAAFGLGRASAGGAPVPAHASSVVVQQGDSLWTIAVRAMPGSDPRDVVGELKSINHLSSADLAVGQRLRLP